MKIRYYYYRQPWAPQGVDPNIMESALGQDLEGKAKDAINRLISTPALLDNHDTATLLVYLEFQRIRVPRQAETAKQLMRETILRLAPAHISDSIHNGEYQLTMKESARFDYMRWMVGYHEAHSVANLIGAPVGYKDNDQGGALSDGLRRNANSVVLLDEIEKAHPDVMNIFLSVFDEGRITDNRGRLVDCSNAIFVLTSNMGAGEVDFRTAGSDELRTLAERFMRRELVNRISGVIGFQPLGSEQMAKILDQIIVEKSRMFEAEKGLRIEVDQLARKALLDRGYSPDLGARPLERAVDEMIVQPLVDAWFGNRLRTGMVRFSVSGTNAITFSQD